MTVDLMPVTVDAPQRESADVAVIVKTEVGNRGSSPSGDYTVQFRLSLDDTMDSSDRVIQTEERSSIPAGGRDRWEQLLSLPDDVAQGTYFVGVTIDHGNSIAESDESNNIHFDSNPISLLKGLPRLSECETLGTPGTDYQTGVNCRTMMMDGYPRTYIVYVPNGLADDVIDAYPMVTMFHGSTGHGLRFLNASGWREKGDEVGLISVYPTSMAYCEIDSPCENGKLSGWTTKWNNRNFIDNPEFNFDVTPPSYPESAAWPPDDDGFISAVWDDVEALLPIDADRMYATGFSNGGGRTRQLSMDMTDRLAAAAYVGTLRYTVDPATPPDSPIPLYTVLGTDDPKIIELAGLSPGDELPLAPNDILANSVLNDLVTHTLDLLKLSYDEANLRPDSVQTDAISTRLSWNRPVEGNESKNEYHLSVWKDLVHYYPRLTDSRNPHGFVAADTFWEFFQQHTKSNEPLPDLIPTLVDAPDVGSLDEPFLMPLQVENRGLADSGEYTVQLRLSLDDTIDHQDLVIMNLNRSSIAAGEVDSWEQVVRIPDTVPQGEFFIGVTVDSGDQVAESDDNNNQLVDSHMIELYKGLPLSQCDSFGPAGMEYVPGVNCRTIDIDDYPRIYVVYVPESVFENDSVPTLTMLHGHTGHSRKFLNTSGWREKADEEGFIAAFPTSAMYCDVGRPCEDGRLSGWSTRWDNGLEALPEVINLDVRPPGYPEMDAPWPADEVAFIGAMFDDMEDLLPVDTYRNYVSGFSSGAQFARRLLFEIPDRLAAVAIVGGGLDSARDPDFEPSEGIPLYLAVGDRDEKVLQTYGLQPNDIIPLDANQILDIMGDTVIDGTLSALQLDHDPNSLVPDQIHSDEVSTRLTWSTPLVDQDTEFHLAVWGDLAHHYPATPSADKNPNGFSAPDIFWQFFESHSKRVPGDSNGDGVFNSQDLVQVFIAGEYEDGIDGNSTYAEGDWNGDRDFDSADLVDVFQAATYVNAATPVSDIASVASLFDADDESRGLISGLLTGGRPSRESRW